uniref:EamA domain-containing protein n=1 Tax=Chromera velia CCMP2878 TaxID=1169474 RepID=A0A0G4IE79_9ALVE|eukprot:Cvel_13515.t1-p1 / transcript=Cvel_13515.t1 / gene=Cvel_13515 / organism=Chromera_velia_CCMP2878 / gene_product=hypothetical protein / transcript_product=hypothetical protein / location=Cvel_scaffold927:5336-7521(-) / protein_length=247 / sequence_SO=supercontig / SO=protein_coding / is_pseudo=false
MTSAGKIQYQGREGGGMGGRALLGCGIAVVSSILWGTNYVWLRKLKGRCHPVQTTIAFCWCGMVLCPCLMLVLPEEDIVDTVRRSLTPDLWPFALILGFCAVGGQIALAAALHWIPAALAALINALEVPSVYAVQAALFGEPTSALEIAGACVIVLSCAVNVVAGVWKTKREAQERPGAQRVGRTRASLRRFGLGVVEKSELGQSLLLSTVDEGGDETDDRSPGILLAESHGGEREKEVVLSCRETA